MAATQKDNDDIYAETAEMPFRPQRQTRQHRIIHSPLGTTDDLVAEQCVIAAEDGYQCSQVAGATKVRSASAKLLQDFDKAVHMADILKAVHRRVIEAIIDGTIGHKYYTDPQFRKLFPPLDDLAGVYLNTLVCKRDGKGLTANEWKRLQEIMQRYLDGLGRVIGPDSTQDERDTAIEAAKIYCKFCMKATETWDTVLEDANQGKRPLIQKSGGQKFCDTLSNRIRMDFDPDVRQLQMPVHIGCSESLRTRMACYGPMTGMHRVPEVWRLTTCCLEYMGIKMEHIGLPIMKIYKREHLDLAEIQFTLLAGSMIDWGGFNPAAAGGHPSGWKPTPWLDDAKTQTIVELPWAWENLNHSTMVTSRRVKGLEFATNLLQSDKQEQTIQGHLHDGKAMLERRTKAIEKAEEAIKDVKAATKALQEHNGKLSEVAAKKQIYLDFADNFDKWLNGEAVDAD